MAEPRPPTRDVLAKFLPDQESIRRFEKLFLVVSELTPAEIATLTRLVQEASIDANTAQATAQSALDQLGQVVQDAAINAGAADGKAAQALDLLASIAQSLDLLAKAPPHYHPQVVELADVRVSQAAPGDLLIYDGTSKCWLNALLTEGANVTITNGNGSIEIAVASAPPSGSAGGVLGGTYPNPGFAVDMATQTELDAHTGNTSNPHATTNAQVGLSAVTNDAQLKIASNLSDLANAATARTNLGLSTAKSTTGSVASTSGTAVTVFTLDGHSGGAWLVCCDVNSGAPNLYSAVALVTTDGGAARITNLQTATLTAISLSGLDVQATQGSGGSQYIIYTVFQFA